MKEKFDFTEILNPDPTWIRVRHPGFGTPCSRGFQGGPKFEFLEVLAFGRSVGMSVRKKYAILREAAKKFFF